MRSVTVPPDHWRACLDEVSSRHQDEMVSMIVVALDGVPAAGASGQALQGISLDPGVPDHCGVSIVVTGEAGQLEHHVRAPVTVELLTADSGADEALSIEDATGEISVIRFSASPALA